MKLAVFGATGQVGREVVRQALEAGHEVRAFARRREGVPEPATAVVGELSDEAAIRRAIAGADAVVSALGARTNTADQPPLFADALDRITRAMKAEGVRRLVSISGAALHLPGDPPPKLPRSAIIALMSLVARHVLDAKRREHAVIAATDLDWVLVRPGRIVSGGQTGTARAVDAPGRAQVTAGDVAAVMLACTTGETWIRRAPFVG